jgi:predicted DNA-binding ribbon-helix-helix protein
MKSSVVERSSLEDAFWKGLQEITERHNETLSDRQFANLSSAIGQEL